MAAVIGRAGCAYTEGHRYFAFSLNLLRWIIETDNSVTLTFYLSCHQVFLPSDDQYVWLLAKMWYNQAETTYHQSVAHLGNGDRAAKNNLIIVY